MGLFLLTRPLGFIFRPISMLMRGDFRGLFALLLGFAVLGGLWEAALFSLSTPATATAVMTEAGVAVINPGLGAMGLGPVALANIQADAATHPNDAVQIPGLKTQAIALTKADLVGLTFDQATRKIYGNVAKAYYGGGPDAVFTVPMPSVSLVPDSHLDWLTALGLSTTTLTARGHAQTQQLGLYLWGAAGLLGLLVLLLSKGWTRLYGISHALFTGAVPGLALIGIVAFLWGRAPGIFTPFSTLLHVVGGAVVPIYVTAGIAAIAALVAGMLGSAATKTAKVAKSVHRSPAPVAAPRSAPSAASSYRPYDPAPAPAPSAYANMPGSNMPGSNMAGSPQYGTRPYGQSPAPSPAYSQQAYGQQQDYAAGQNPLYGQAPSYQQPYSQRWSDAGRQPSFPFDAPSQQPSPASGAGTDGWLTDTPQSPVQPEQQRGYPDYGG